MNERVTTMIRGAGPEDLAEVRRLFLEYTQSLGFSLCFQGFDEELASLPGAYAPPGGVLILALAGEEPVGVVGLRPLAPGICEMKRLYVRPEHRGLGLGRALAEAVIEKAKNLGYRAIRLDTLPTMAKAREIYAEMGFVPIPAYYDNSPCGSLCLEKSLTDM